jgi:phage repressor protein C with HTH and peptisase S24 domain
VKKFKLSEKIMETTVAHRLAKAREALGLSQRAFAKTLDISNSTISLWEKGKGDLSYFSTQAIEQIHNISANWLLTGKGEMMVNGIRVMGNMEGQEAAGGANNAVTIHLLSLIPISGDGSELAHYLDEPGGVLFDRQWLRKVFGVSPDNLCMVEMDDVSMSPMVNAGELLFVDGRKTTPPFRGGVWVLRHDGQLFVRRVKSGAPQQYIATSDNPDYPPIEVDNTALLGRVVGGPPRRF